MSEAITSAHVSGPLGQALAVVNGETWLFEAGRSRRRPTANDIRFFFDFGLEVRPVAPEESSAGDGDSLRALLDTETRKFRALRALLVGMDAELDDELRLRGMRRSEVLLGDPTVAAFVETRFLRPVDDVSWSLPDALALAQSSGLSKVQRLYAIVRGPWLLRLEGCIREWAAEQGDRSLQQATAVVRAYETGLIAAVATAAHDEDRSRVHGLVFKASAAGWNPRLVVHLANLAAPKDRAVHADPAEQDEHAPTVVSTDGSIVRVRRQIVQALEAYDARRSRNTRRADSGGARNLDAVLRQVEWIVTQLRSNNDRVAWRAIGELAQRQISQGGAGYFAQSLTNIATQISGRTSVAQALLEFARLCAPNDATVPSANANLLMQSGRLAEALAAYDRTVEQFPDNAVARTGRAETLRALGRLAEALAAYDRTVEQFPEDAVARNGRAETLRALGRLAEALAAYDRTVEQFPDDVFARNGRAETLRALGRLAEALAAYDRTVEQFPDDVFARNGRAETLRALGRLAEALAAYDRTVEQFPEDAVAHTGRAETLRALGRLEEALAAYDRTVEQFPDNAVARTGRAETLRALGRLAEALAAYDRTVEQFPEDAVARTGRAETLRALGRLAEALAAYDRTVAQFPENAVARNGRAVVLIGLGRSQEARQELQTAAATLQTPGDWVAAHIVCMIDLQAGATAELASRLRRLVLACPHPHQQRYFETTLAVVQLALRSAGEARETVADLLRRPEFEAGERQVLHLMRAHAEAADGDIPAARASLDAASNLVPYEDFAARRLRQEIERRYGLDAGGTPMSPTEIADLDTTIIRLEADMWVSHAARSVAMERRVA